MHATDVVGYVAEGEFYCPGCTRFYCPECKAEDITEDPAGVAGDMVCPRCNAPWDADDGPCAVFASSEWDYYPTCGGCGETCEDVDLTLDGYRWLKLEYETPETPYTDRLDFLWALYMWLSDNHKGQWSKEYRDLCRVGRLVSGHYLGDFGRLTDNQIAYYAVIDRKRNKVVI